MLAALAAGFGLDAETFAVDLQSQAVKEETWRDYAISRGAGVNGFPTLIVGPREDGTYSAIARGFQAWTAVLPAIESQLGLSQP